MSELHWDAAAGMTVRQANALFDAVSLAWFDALCRPIGEDPCARFEQFLRESIANGTENSPRAADTPPQDAAVALRWPTLRRSGEPAATPSENAANTRETSIHSASKPAVRSVSLPAEPTTAPGRFIDGTTGSDRVRTTAAPAKLLASASSPAAAALSEKHSDKNTRSRVALSPLPASIPIAQPADLVPAAPAPPAAERLRTPSMTRAPERPRTVNRYDDRGHLPANALVARSIGSAAPTQVSARLPQRPVSSATPANSERVPQNTQLVSSVTAIRGLLQSAVNDSRERHASTTPATTPRVEPVTAATAMAVPETLRALPAIDALSEEILVDRLADRLEERLREQTLRHFGFTGGLV